MSKIIHAILAASDCGHMTIRMENKLGEITKVQSFKKGEKVKTYYNVNINENNTN